MEKNLKLLYQVRHLFDAISSNNTFTSGPFTFTIGDTSKFGVYSGGGTVTEVKKPETVQFVSID